MEKVKLGEYVNIRTGKLDANASNINGKYPFFTCSNEPLKINNYSYDCECVLVAGNGDLNVKYYNGKFDAYQRTYIIEPKNRQLLETKYLYYLVNSKIDKLRRESIGGVIKYIKLGNLTNIELLPIDIEKQRNVIETLDKVQEIIDISEKQIQELDKLIKSQFIEMFENEKYPKKTLSDLTDKITDGSHNPPTGIAENQGYMMLSSQNIINNSINYDNVRYLKKEDFEKENRRTDLQKGDVLLTIVGTVGRTAIMTEESNIVLQRSVAVIKPNKEINSAYLVGALNSESVINQLNKGAKGVAQKGIYLNDLKKIIIIVPPIELQNQFAEFVKLIDKKKFEIQKILEEMEKLQESLMNKYFGE